MTIFLIQYFCLHGILLFYRSYPEVDQLQSTSEESFLTRDVTLLFVQRFVQVFNQRRKQLMFFHIQKHILNIF